MEKNLKNNLKMAKFLLKIEKNAYKFAKKQGISVKDKGASGHDLVTNYDTSIEKFIIKQLDKNFPGVKIVSEEFCYDVKPEGTFFVIDPVDGTINFANNIFDRWGVQIAYVENDETLSSAIFNPKLGEFIAGKGEGAYKNGKRFVVQKHDLQHCLLSIDAHAEETGKALNILEKHVLKFRKTGAACVDHLFTAQGNFGVYIECICKPWDYIPGEIFCKEAGCALNRIGRYHLIGCSTNVLNQIEKILKDARFNFE